MEIFYLFIALFVIFVVKTIYDTKNKKELLEFQLEGKWGNLSEEEMSPEKLNTIEKYFVSKYNKETDIDEITWYDLDMDEIYMRLNTSCSGIGEEYLYYLLHNLQFSKEELDERDRVIEYLRKDKVNRKKIQMALKALGKFDNFSVFEYFTRTDDIEIKNPKKHYICPIGLLGSIAMLFVNVEIAAFMIIGFLIYNITSYFKVKAEIEKYFQIFSYILRITDVADEFKDIKNEEIQKYVTRIREEAAPLMKMRKGSKFVIGGRGLTGGLEDIFMDYVRMLFHVDIIRFNQMLNTLRTNRDHLMNVYETIGYLDSMLCIASYRDYLKGDYCVPRLHNNKAPELNLINVYHPLIKNPVKNTMMQNQSALLTGSNASGKSTFLKTVAINGIFAQTMNTCLCSVYEGSFFRIYSSMALQDNIFNNESYYIVEIKSLKRILDQVNPKIPTLCFVDEVLRGTNTLERISASAEILYTLAKHNVLCLAATHDIELTHILEKQFSNYHFQEEVVDNDVLFDYKLYKGRAVSKNAIKLLKIIGYDDKLIKAATNRANSFLETGEWQVFQN